MKLGKVLKKIYLVLGLVIIFTSVYIEKAFNNISFEQLLFTIKTSTGSSFSAIKEGLIFVVGFTILILFIIFIIKKVFSKLFCNFYFRLNIKIVNKQYELRMLPISYFQSKIYCVVFFLLSIICACSNLKIFEYVLLQYNKTLFIETNYISATDVGITFPENKKNLIYIYVESLENAAISKQNGGMVEKSYIPRLEELALENTNFSDNSSIGGGYSTEGTKWTAASLISQTAGIPLKVSIDGNSYSGYGESLPGIYNLGDILKDNGYNNYFMLGSDSNFGGRKDYFSFHGDYEIYDYNWAKKEKLISEDYNVWWGFEDSKLFEFAKIKLTEIVQSNELFNFTLLTADTHFMDGYLDSSCPNSFDNQYASVYYCSDSMVYEFVNWIKDQEFYKNTTIIISGDHPTMQEKFFSVDDVSKRSVYNVFINSAISDANNKNRLFTTMDMFPTTLASLGVKIDGDKLGLGTNLYSNTKTLLEEYGIEQLNEELEKKSDFYDYKLLGNSYFRMKK